MGHTSQTGGMTDCKEAAEASHSGDRQCTRPTGLEYIRSDVPMYKNRTSGMQFPSRTLPATEEASRLLLLKNRLLKWSHKKIGCH